MNFSTGSGAERSAALRRAPTSADAAGGGAGTGDVEGAVVDFQEVFSLCRAPRFVSPLSSHKIAPR